MSARTLIPSFPIIQVAHVLSDALSQACCCVLPVACDLWQVADPVVDREPGGWHVGGGVGPEEEVS